MVYILSVRFSWFLKEITGVELQEASRHVNQVNVLMIHSRESSPKNKMRYFGGWETKHFWGTIDIFPTMILNGAPKQVGYKKSSLYLRNDDTIG